MQKIRIGGQEFTIIVKKKMMRSMRLRIREKNQLEIATPWLTPNIIIEKFIQGNQTWIIRQNNKIGEKLKLNNIKNIEILGERYEVELKEMKSDSLVIIDNKILLNYSKKSQIKEIFDKKMRNLALKLIKDRVQRLAQKYKLDYEKVGVKNQSSRFGSCSHSGNLNFNWQIILFPEDKFEHVILHELTHLTVKNHSKTFWEQLAEYDSKWRENNRWLKKEGTKKFIV